MFYQVPFSHIHLLVTENAGGGCNISQFFHFLATTVEPKIAKASYIDVQEPQHQENAQGNREKREEIVERVAIVVRILRVIVIGGSTIKT